MKKLVSSILILAVSFASVATVPFTSISATAAETSSDQKITSLGDPYASGDGSVETDSDRIIVSLGDSYSSGEGIDEFYGHNLPLKDKVKNLDWLCHRSENSWPGMLKLKDSNGDTITMKDKKAYQDSDGNWHGNWYFAAMSGAVAGNIYGSNGGETKEEKKHRIKTYVQTALLFGAKEIPSQLEVFDKLGDKKADYVTITIGGNDVDFEGVVTAAATNLPYLEYSSYLMGVAGNLPLKLNYMVKKVLPGTLERLKKTYELISDRAGDQAHIIVAGYPKILSANTNNLIFSKNDAEMINREITNFNNQIKATVEECYRGGMNISFVPVEEKFGDCGAYSPDGELINGFKLVKPQDINQRNPVSAYSFHPNEKGAEVYADCVQDEIDKLEKYGRLSGKISKASDRATPIKDATISIYNKGSNELEKSIKSDESGNYSASLPAGEYKLIITADGYMDFCSYATVTERAKTYMETFLMVQGSENEKGVTKGKVVNSLTGAGAEGVTLTIRKGWNNTDESAENIATAKTGSDGIYSVELPLGNYTVIASKAGYISSPFNIIVQSGTTDNQNGIITPQVSGDEYLITLTWGEDPRDLDSHVAGTLSNNESFHVYYNHKQQCDDDIEVCNLDFDDVDSFGPEHITLKATTNKPYYYYIYKYAGNGTVATSNAKVTVHKGNKLICTYNVPTNLGDGDYWNVFAIKDGKLIVNNTITSNADISYAS